MIYPAIVDIVLIYSSIHNVLARILCRQMSSWQIPLVITLLNIMHWFRALIVSSRLFEFDSRVSTVVQREEFEAMTLIDMLIPLRSAIARTVKSTSRQGTFINNENDRSSTMNNLWVLHQTPLEVISKREFISIPELVDAFDSLSCR